MDITKLMLEQAFEDGRYAELDDVLPALVCCATQSSAHGLAYRGFALAKACGHVSSRQVVNFKGQSVANSQLTWLEPDRLLAWLSLEVATLPDEETDFPPVSALVAGVRLGLVARTLDMSHKHLQKRKSFGQKTTRHQLIKTSFSDVYGDVTLLMQQLFNRIDANDYDGLEVEHRKITRLSNQAEKLMGGHGFLMGATHTVSHLSMLLYSIFGKQESTETA